MENAHAFYSSTELTKNKDNLALHDRVLSYNPYSVLEVGCGSGEMLRKYPNSIGIDKNASMVEYAKQQGIEVFLEDITDSSFAKKHRCSFDVVCANYVFTELNSSQLALAFSNCNDVIKPGGHFIFTITNPRIRHRTDLPEYRIQFSEKFDYNKKDLPFTVLLKDSESKEYRDVGIRDFHNSVEVYRDILSCSGFSKIAIEELNYDHGFSHALLFDSFKN